MNDKTANFFSLFASSSTLICCALPAMFVLIGAGASFASLLSVFPFLIILSQYKLAITAAAFAMIVLAGYVNYKTYYMPCPIDPEAGRACMQTRRNSRLIILCFCRYFLFRHNFYVYHSEVFLDAQTPKP